MTNTNPKRYNSNPLSKCSQIPSSKDGRASISKVRGTSASKGVGISTSKRSGISAAFTFASCFSVFIVSLFFSDKIAHSVRSALSLCSSVIIPSVFPFMVISDFLYVYTDFSRFKGIGDAFERIFGVSRAGLYPYVLGLLCGFPLGVKCASELYKSGKLSREEAERVIGFSNNTGPAFLVSGIGLGLRGSIKDGFLLYFVMVASSIIVGYLFSSKGTPETPPDRMKAEKSFSLTASIKNAGINTLNVCSYLTFFACVVGLLRGAIGENYVYLSLIPFLEVGSATSILSKTKLLSPRLSLALSSFAVGFSGLSVHLQAISFLIGTDIRIKRYVLMKLLQGVLSFLITFLLYSVLI